jgi:peptidoglycan hydrolase-like protein with peptidoglycan-binding domain
VGQLIEPGYVLFRLDSQPVLRMNGTTPAYRDLDADDTDGPDILELNANLVALGYNPDGIVVDGEWQPATTDGVDALQKAWGETETGELTLGQIVLLPGAQLVSTVDGAVGSTGGGGNGAAGAALIDPAPKPVVVSLTTPAQTTPTITTSTTTRTTTTATTLTTPAATTPTPTRSAAPAWTRRRSASTSPRLDLRGRDLPGPRGHRLAGMSVQLDPVVKEYPGDVVALRGKSVKVGDGERAARASKRGRGCGDEAAAEPLQISCSRKRETVERVLRGASVSLAEAHGDEPLHNSFRQRPVNGEVQRALGHRVAG